MNWHAKKYCSINKALNTVFDCNPVSYINSFGKHAAYLFMTQYEIIMNGITYSCPSAFDFLWKHSMGIEIVKKYINLM